MSMGTRESARRSHSEEERRTAERRRKRMKKQKQKKTKKILLIILGLIAAAALIAGIIFAIKSSGIGSGEARISAKNGTFRIVLDAGHGGADTGLYNDTLVEKDATLGIASKLKIMLEEFGYEVVLTREDDTRLSKDERVQAVKDAAPDLVVSIHVNYSDDPSAAGMTAFYKKGSSEGQLLAQNIVDSAASEASAVNNGFSVGGFSILNDTDVPAALIEVGYSSNEADAANLMEDTYRNLAAKGIAKGIIHSLARE